jgi:hypothetical protein
MNDKHIPCFRHSMNDFDKIISKQKWDAIEVDHAWRYITAVQVHLRKDMTIQITLGAADLPHSQTYQPILSNYRQLIEEEFGRAVEAVSGQDATEATTEEEVD